MLQVLGEPRHCLLVLLLLLRCLGAALLQLLLHLIQLVPGLCQLLHQVQYMVHPIVPLLLGQPGILPGFSSNKLMLKGVVFLCLSTVPCLLLGKHPATAGNASSTMRGARGQIGFLYGMWGVGYRGNGRCQAQLVVPYMVGQCNAVQCSAMACHAPTPSQPRRSAKGVGALTV